MNTLLAVLLLAAAVVDPSPRQDVTGAWEFRLSADWTTLPDLVCNLTRKDRHLSGACRAVGDEGGPSVELTGTVEADAVSVQWKVPTPDGATWTYALTGTADAKRTQIKGTLRISGASGGGGEGTFLATRR